MVPSIVNGHEKVKGFSMDVTDQLDDRADLLSALKGYLEELRDTGVDELEFAEVVPAAAGPTDQSAAHVETAASPAADGTPTGQTAVSRPACNPAATTATTSGQELCRSFGDLHARVLFMMTGQGFAGEAGGLLKKIVGAMGFEPEQVHLICISQTSGALAQATREELLSRITQVAPEVVIVLGEPAAHLLLAKHLPLADLRGKFHRLAGTKVAVTDHPQALVDDPSLKREVWSEMKRVMAYLAQQPQ
jgi:DNA polymerase